MTSQDLSSEPQHICSMVIYQDGRYLLVQENKPEALDEWNFSGGRRERGETLEQTAIRESKEEVGYKVEIVKKLIEVDRMAENRKLHAFLGRIIGGELHLQGSEIKDAQWFSRDEIFRMTDNLRDSQYILDAIAASTSS